MSENAEDRPISGVKIGDTVLVQQASYGLSADYLANVEDVTRTAIIADRQKFSRKTGRTLREHDPCRISPASPATIASFRATKKREGLRSQIAILSEDADTEHLERAVAALEGGDA